MARARAPSLPGRTRSQRSALSTTPARRGSMTMSVAPRALARLIRAASARLRSLGIVAPEEHAARVLVVRLRRARAVGILRTPAPMPAAEMVGVQDVGAAKGVGQALHPGVEVGSRGPAADAQPNTTASGPYRALISPRREAVRAMASSQEMRVHRGRAPLGAGAYQGVLEAVRRVDDLGGSCPLTQMHPLGCSGSAVTLVNLPSSTVATTPHRDLHIAQ